MSRTEYPTLSKAPITLAIMEMQFNAAPGINNKSLVGLKEKLSDWFPIYSERKSAEIEISEELTKQTPLAVKSISTDGHVFTSESKEIELVLSSQMFNFRRYSNYTTWENFKEEAITLWKRCEPHINPVSTNRVSLRYINKIEIDKEKDNKPLQPTDCFNTYIGFNNEKLVPPFISNYNLRYTVPYVDEQITVHFAQKLDFSNTDKLPFIVDIDVLYNNEDKFDFEFLVTKWNELRDIKNKYFFENLTQKTLDILR